MNYFDWEFYVSRYKDLKANGITNKEKAIWHYKNYGKNEGRYCNKNEINYKERSNDLITCTSKEELIKNIKYWNWKAYKNNHPDLKNLLNQELLKHLLNFGFKENREIIIDKKNLSLIDYSSLIYNFNLLLPIDFDWKQYLYLNKDLEDSNLNEIQCKVHYILHGNLEERNYKSINIIGFKFLNVSISENMFLLKKYIEKNNKFPITIYDISELDKINLNMQTIFCIQPFEITKIIPLLSNFKIKPEVLWVWEFKSLPQIFKEYEKYFSKVYVPSQFCYDVFSNHLAIPIQKIELKSMIHDYIDKIENHIINNSTINNILENIKYKTIYGFCFDLNSSIIRKNPSNLVEAFNNLNDDTKVLILKYRLPRDNRFINKVENDIYNSFITEVKKNKNIYTITDELEPLDLYKLYTNFDYYITPHCGEGFGLTIYDNMVLGNKIISPYYSGETEYLNREGIIELEYEEKEIPELKEHPIYGQMNDFKGAYISVENIKNSIFKSKKNVLVLGLIRNIKNNIYYFSKTIENLNSVFNCKFSFLTNNNSDNTEELLDKLSRKNKNFTVYYYDNDKYNIYNRTSYLAKLRNKNYQIAKKQFNNYNFDLICIFDTDLNTIISKQIFKNYDLGCPTKNWDIITSNTVIGKEEYYFDIFALRLLNEDDKLDNKYPLLSKYYGKTTDWVEINYQFNIWKQVKSAFGGFIFINNKYNNFFKLDEYYDENLDYQTCEHLNFCKKFKYIYVNPNFKYNNDLTWKNTQAKLISFT